MQLEWTEKGLAFRALMIRLQELADHNSIMIGDYDEDPVDGVSSFDMAWFCSTPTGVQVTAENFHTCGAVACAIGWCNLMIEPSPDTETFEGYFERVLVRNKLTQRQLEAVTDWLFHGLWGWIAPNPRDVVTRVDYISTPEGFDRVIRAYETTDRADWAFWSSQLWKEITDDKVV